MACRQPSVNFRAMGTDCHVVVVTEASLADQLLTLSQDRVELLEDCWSRFRPTSELNRLNAAAGLGPIVGLGGPVHPGRRT